MATILQTLKLASTQRRRNVSQTEIRRNKLVKVIHEQIEAAKAAQEGRRYTIEVTRKMKNRLTGEQMLVQKAKRVRECWWLGDDGKYYAELRYGWKPLEFGKGKVAVEVGDLSNLVNVLEKFRDAAMLGEFDEQLSVASSRLAMQLQAKRSTTSTSV